MRTIHIIPNAHIDPVWLWPWQAGLDAVLATCRSACERLERHPGLTFCQGEAWVYREIQRCDPELFTRITGHISSGRWSLVGGWWIQPDCNGPSGWAMRKQIAIGLRYFQDSFQARPRTAFSIDSFGHAATLPTLMREMGQDRYVMMRPQEHEMQLPARVFRWRERPGAPEVTVFRIAGSYNGGG
jgi:alpha-mannosidase